MEKEFIIDNGSSVSTMPADNKKNERYRNSKSETPIKRCKQERSKIPRVNTRRHRIGEQQAKDAITNYRKK